MPNTAVFKYVTSVKGLGNWANQGSIGGGTMLWINGLSKFVDLNYLPEDSAFRTPGIGFIF